MHTTWAARIFTWYKVILAKISVCYIDSKVAVGRRRTLCRTRRLDANNTPN